MACPQVPLDLSFGDVPFVKLSSANEKNRKGSTVPVSSDLASDLKAWTEGRQPGQKVFDVPAGLLRILNRDLVAAGIDKIDELGGRVHLHAIRHSTGTHLSKAGVHPRTAQSVMRHSDIDLTMNTYTDAGLLDTAGAIECLPQLPLGRPRNVAPNVAPNVAEPVQKLRNVAQIAGQTKEDENTIE